MLHVHLVVIFCQIVCAALLATGVLFILIELRTKYDKAFLYFGIALVIGSLMAAIDLWVTPSNAPLESKLFWERALHVLACFIFPVSLAYHIILTNWTQTWTLKAVIALSIICLPLVYTELMLTTSGGKVTGGVLYYPVFFSFAALYMGSANYALIWRLRRSQGQEKRTFALLLVGFLILCIFGLVDMAGVASQDERLFPSFKIIGILVFGIMATVIFSEKFLQFLNEKNEVFLKLQSAFRDLEQANALKQIGESTAIMNHEFKNYMFMISGNAQLLEIQETLSEKGKGLVQSINRAVDRMGHFTEDILDLSKAHVLKEKHPVCIPEMIKDLVERKFSRNKSNFELIGFEQKLFIHGDWAKLEQAFTNVIKNALESASEDQPLHIKMEVRQDEGVLLLTIEDNGVGCEESDLARIFNAFYTTKKSSGGTGLGLSITRNIVEIHGGRISAYSKNIGRKKAHGLIVNITIPIYQAELEKRLKTKHPIVLITQEMENLQHVVRIFHNVIVNPHIIKTPNELSSVPGNAKNMAIIISTKALGDNYEAFSEYPHLVLMSQHKQNAYALDNKPDAVPVIFSEEYLLKDLLPRVAVASEKTRKSSTTKFKAIT